MTECRLPGTVHIVNSLKTGGAETLVVRMVGAIAKSCDVYVICLDELGAWADDLRKDGIPVYCLWRQPGIDLRISFLLASFCRRHNVQIIHAHQCTPWFYSGLSRYLYPAPRLLFEEHGRLYPEEKKPERAFVNRWFIQPRTHRIVAVSRDVKERLVRYEGLAPQRIEVIYNGVTPSPAFSACRRTEIRKSLGVPTDAFLVGSVGRIDPIKNYRLLVESMAAVARNREKLCGIIIGDGPDREPVELMVRSCNLEDRFILTGYRSDAREIIECLDLFVLCSLSEGTSVALLEAMSAGIPVVVTDVGGNPEIVTNGQTGWVIPSNSKSSLVEAINEAAGDREKALRYADAGKKRYEDMFAFESMLSRYTALYREMTSRRMNFSDGPGHRGNLLKRSGRKWIEAE